jgi:hypothetical protein
LVLVQHEDEMSHWDAIASGNCCSLGTSPASSLLFGSSPVLGGSAPGAHLINLMRGLKPLREEDGDADTWMKSEEEDKEGRKEGDKAER